MIGSFPSAVRGRWRPGGGFLFRVGRRTLVESLYLLTAPVTALAGLLLVGVGLCVGTAGLLLPGRSPVVARAAALARWSADLERWRIARVRSPLGPAARAEGAGQRPRQPVQAAAASDPGLWLDAAHAVAVIPVVLVTSVPMRACARRSPPARICPAPPCWCSASTWRRPTPPTCSRTARARSATC